jgi:hypothetical protein
VKDQESGHGLVATGKWKQGTGRGLAPWPWIYGLWSHFGPCDQTNNIQKSGHEKFCADHPKKSFNERTRLKRLVVSGLKPVRGLLYLFFVPLTGHSEPLKPF